MRAVTVAHETVRTHAVFPRELVAEVDRLVGRRKRSAFVTAAVAEKVERERLGRALARTAGFLSADEHPNGNTPADVSAWVREQRTIDEATELKLTRRPGS